MTVRSKRKRNTTESQRRKEGREERKKKGRKKKVEKKEASRFDAACSFAYAAHRLKSVPPRVRSSYARTGKIMELCWEWAALTYNPILRT